MAGTQATYESAASGLLSQVTSAISSASGLAGPFAAAVSAALLGTIVPLITTFSNAQMQAIMLQYNQSVAEAVGTPLKSANQQYSQLYQGFNNQSMAVGQDILNVKKLTGTLNEQISSQGAQISANNSQIASILASNTTPTNPDAIKAYALNQIAVPTVPTTVGTMSDVLGNIASASPQYAKALVEKNMNKISNNSISNAIDSVVVCAKIGAGLGQNAGVKSFFTCMQPFMIPVGTGMPTVYAKFQALMANAITPVSTPECNMGDNILNVYCYAEKVRVLLKGYFVELVANNTHLLQSASQIALGQSGLASSAYDTQAISNINSLYNYNMVANQMFLKSQLSYLDYTKNALQRDQQQYLTIRQGTKMLVR
ncbi:hypothetical protein HMPREF1430_00245 [Helicobacter pylori GAM96Ai]|nr:hypothetical protein HMPREF1430_00245 [Helicobacter pylori GAM96Ai]